jgi:hypothetical protein
MKDYKLPRWQVRLLKLWGFNPSQIALMQELYETIEKAKDEDAE